MFKHIIKGLLCLIFMWSFLLPASAENSAGTPPDITADSAIVINADTGTVYYEKNADKADARRQKRRMSMSQRTQDR